MGRPVNYTVLKGDQMAPRGRKSKTPASEPITAGLLEALKFVSFAQKSTGEIRDTHCIIENNTVVAFNGILAAGHKIAEDIRACPHTQRMIDALSKCGDTLAITQLDRDRLSVRSENFRAVIDCVNASALSPATPDAPIIAVNDVLKRGFLSVADIVSDTSDYVMTASILLQSGSMLATNRHVIFEYWHGLAIPEKVAIPKLSAMAVAKTTAKLISIGLSERTITFWFENDSWLRTQRYTEEWPNINLVLDVASKPWPTPTVFYAALEAVGPFCEDNKVYFSANRINSHREDNIGASYDVQGLPKERGFDIRYLKLLEKRATTIDFTTYRDKLLFFGDSIRGAIAGLQIPEE